MLTTVVGSFPHKLYSPSTFSEKIKNTLGQFDPYKKTIRDIVFDELKAGVDIVADGGVREMNMINYFSRYMPGMKIDGKTTELNLKSCLLIQILQSMILTQPAMRFGSIRDYITFLMKSLKIRLLKEL